LLKWNNTKIRKTKFRTLILQSATKKTSLTYTDANLRSKELTHM